MTDDVNLVWRLSIYWLFDKVCKIRIIQGLQQSPSEGDSGGGRQHWQSDEGDGAVALYRKNNHDR